MNFITTVLVFFSAVHVNAKSLELSMFNLDGHVYGKQVFSLPTKPGTSGAIVAGDLRCEIDSMSFTEDGAQHVHMTIANAQTDSVFDGTIFLDRFFYLTLGNVFCKIEIIK